MKSLYQFLEESKILNETYINLFSSDDKIPYAEKVFELIQQSYSPIGGMKGSGFRSADDMVKNIPFWKLVRRNGEIVAGAMYKDKGGRKRVAVFTNGRPDGKNELAKIYQSDFTRAFVETSDGSLGFMIKVMGIDFVVSMAKTHQEVEAILKEPIQKSIDKNDPNLQKFPALTSYFYQREIGGKLKTKVMLGTTGKKIINSE